MLTPSMKSLDHLVARYAPLEHVSEKDVTALSGAWLTVDETPKGSLAKAAPNAAKPHQRLLKELTSQRIERTRAEAYARALQTVVVPQVPPEAHVASVINKAIDGAKLDHDITRGDARSITAAITAALLADPWPTRPDGTFHRSPADETRPAGFDFDENLEHPVPDIDVADIESDFTPTLGVEGTFVGYGEGPDHLWLERANGEF